MPFRKWLGAKGNLLALLIVDLLLLAVTVSIGYAIFFLIVTDRATFEDPYIRWLTTLGSNVMIALLVVSSFLRQEWHSLKIRKTTHDTNEGLQGAVSQQEILIRATDSIEKKVDHVEKKAAEVAVAKAEEVAEARARQWTEEELECVFIRLQERICGGVRNIVREEVDKYMKVRDDAADQAN